MSDRHISDDENTPDLIQGNGDWENSVSGQHWVHRESGQRRVKRETSPEIRVARATRGAFRQALAAIIGAAIMGGTALAWDSFRSKVTEGKADVVEVEKLRTENDAAHSEIKQDLGEVKAEQKAAGHILRRVARKLKIEE